jgi:predicted site-specific integrase-resolvase
MYYNILMKSTYSPQDFGQLIGRKTKTLQMSPEQELAQDLIAIVTVFSSRLHGLRSYKKVLKDAALQKDQT